MCTNDAISGSVIVKAHRLETEDFGSFVILLHDHHLSVVPVVRVSHSPEAD